MSPSFAERIVTIMNCQHLEQLSIVDGIETGEESVLTMDNRCLHISSISEALIIVMTGLVIHKLKVRSLIQLLK